MKTPSAEDIAFFASVPWCAAHLSQPRHRVTDTYSRTPKSSTEDSFMAVTLKSSDTIRRCISLLTLVSEDGGTTPAINSVKTFFDLGSGLNGFPHIAHGGLVATLLDEEMGILLTVNQEFLNQRPNAGKTVDIVSMTAYMNIKYLAPVQTPGIIMATARFTKVEGRKKFISAVISDKDGKECAVAEALFIDAKNNPRL